MSVVVVQRDPGIHGRSFAHHGAPTLLPTPQFSVSHASKRCTEASVDIRLQPFPHTKAGMPLPRDGSRVPLIGAPLSARACACAGASACAGVGAATGRSGGACVVSMRLLELQEASASLHDLDHSVAKAPSWARRWARWSVAWDTHELSDEPSVRNLGKAGPRLFCAACTLARHSLGDPFAEGFR
jgi:hypothetical protein